MSFFFSLSIKQQKMFLKTLILQKFFSLLIFFIAPKIEQRARLFYSQTGVTEKNKKRFCLIAYQWRLDKESITWNSQSNPNRQKTT